MLPLCVGVHKVLSQLPGPECWLLQQQPHQQEKCNIPVYYFYDLS